MTLYYGISSLTKALEFAGSDPRVLTSFQVALQPLQNNEVSLQ